MRITHLPSGIVVSCQNEKSQLQNQASQALRILRARHARGGAARAADAEPTAADRQQARSARSTGPNGSGPTTIPENRITDHRVGYKAYNLDQVLDGDLDGVIQSLVDADNAAALGLDAP